MEVLVTTAKQVTSQWKRKKRDKKKKKKQWMAVEIVKLVKVRQKIMPKNGIKK